MFDRTWFGFDTFVVSSTNVPSPSKLIFVKPVYEKEIIAKKKEMSPPVSRSDKGMCLVLHRDMCICQGTNPIKGLFLPVITVVRLGISDHSIFSLNIHKSKREYVCSRNSH